MKTIDGVLKMDVLINNEKKHYLFLGDILVLLVAYLLAAIIEQTIARYFDMGMVMGRLNWLFFYWLLVLPFIFYIFDLYNQTKWRHSRRVLLYIVFALLTALAVVASLSYVFFPIRTSFKGSLFLNSILLLLIMPLIFTWRRLFVEVISRKIKSGCKTVFVGGCSILSEMVGISREIPNLYAHSVIAIDHPAHARDVALANRFIDLAHDNNISRIIVSDRLDEFPLLRRQLLESKLSGTVIYDAPRFYEAMTGRVPIKHVQDSWFLFHNQGAAFNPKAYRLSKRFIDVVLSLTGLIVSLPIFAYIALVIKLMSKGPVFFKQERLGLNEEPFCLLKFRTMVDGAERVTGPVRASKGDKRVTGIGRILRKTRLDELPNLLNIVKGDMSFVGPRPIRKYFADQLAECNPYYRLRFKVKPGATGWAQVKGTYADTLESDLEKLEYDLYYVQNQSLALDLSIIIRTVKTVLLRKGQ